MRKYDVAVIGWGKAGKTLAGTLAKSGKRVVIIEQNRAMVGGTCINEGCIPSKILSEDSRLIKRLEADKSAYINVHERKVKLVEFLREKNFEKLDTIEGLDIEFARASFVDVHILELSYEDGTKLKLQADKIIVNTGAKSFIPNIEGLNDSKNVITSREMLDFEELPQTIGIIGAGYIGCEFSATFLNFGANVTMLQLEEDFLPREDRDVATSIESSLTKKGLDKIRIDKIIRVNDTSLGVEITYIAKGVEKKKEFSKVLLATGRRVDFEGLGLDKALVKLNDRKMPILNKHLQASNEDIFFVGDAAGGLQFTYISYDDFRIVKSKLLEDGSFNLDNRKNVPYSVFMDPTFSRVGLSEAQAVEAGYDFKLFKLKSGAIPKARVLDETDGFLKILVDNKTNLILGAHLHCVESHEMIATIKLAMDANLPYTFLRDTIYTHPTMIESLNDLLS